MKYGVASLQLLVQYPQLPAYLIGSIQTIIWHIEYFPCLSLNLYTVQTSCTL